MRREEIVGSHVAIGTHGAFLGVRLASLMSSRKLEEIIDLLSVLLILLLRCALLATELHVPYLAVSRDGPVRTEALLAQADDADAVVHVAREHVLVRS